MPRPRLRLSLSITGTDGNGLLEGIGDDADEQPEEISHSVSGNTVVRLLLTIENSSSNTSWQWCSIHEYVSRKAKTTFDMTWMPRTAPDFCFH